MSYLVFECLGQPDKDLAATAVVRALKKAHSKRQIVVVSANPEVWWHNPNVYRVYKAGAMPYFYDDYIHNQETIIHRLDPFQATDAIYRRRPLNQIWCELCQVPSAGDKSELYFTGREREVVGKLMAGASAGRPTLLVQAREPYRALAKEIATKVLEQGYAVIQLESLNFDLRRSLAAPIASDWCLSFDSYLDGAAVALDKPVIAFGPEDPTTFHQNDIIKMVLAKLKK